MRLRHVPWLLASLLSSTAALAEPATATATAKISNLNLALIDLAPDDGVAPDVMFEGGTHFRLAIDAPDHYDQEMLHSLPSENYRFAPGQYELHYANASAWAEAFLDGFSTTVTVTAMDDGTLGPYIWASSRWNHDEALQRFTLTPHTQLVISGEYHLSAQVSAPSAAAHASFQLLPLTEVFDTSAWDAAFTESPSFTDTRSGQFSVAITNTGSENLSGLLIFRASALAGTAQPVPEASPTLLALLGTGLAAGLTHRRRQRRHT